MVESVLLIFLVFLCCVFTFQVPCCDVRYDFRIDMIFDSSLPPVVCGRLVSCLRYFCLCIVVSNTYCVVFLFCSSSSCVPYVVSFSGLSIFDCLFRILYRLYIISIKKTIYLDSPKYVTFYFGNNCFLPFTI